MLELLKIQKSHDNKRLSLHIYFILSPNILKVLICKYFYNSSVLLPKLKAIFKIIIF